MIRNVSSRVFELQIVETHHQLSEGDETLAHHLGLVMDWRSGAASYGWLREFVEDETN
jgi:hypothetical protein